MKRVVIFSEINSEFGYLYISKLLKTPDIELVALVTGYDSELCTYYLKDPIQYNLKNVCLKNNVKVLQISDINSDESVHSLKLLNPDYFFIANYQKILDKSVFNIPNKMTIVFHPSQLPKYAGLAPFFWMAKKAETESGVSAIKIAERIDAGEIIHQIPITLKGNETSIKIRQIHFKKSVELLELVLEKIRLDSIVLMKQNLKERTYFGAPTNNDLFLSWNMTCEQLLRTIRAGYRYPSAYFHSQLGVKIKVLTATTVPRNIFLHKRHKSHVGASFLWNDKLYINCLDGYLRIDSVDSNEGEIPFRFDIVKNINLLIDRIELDLLETLV